MTNIRSTPSHEPGFAWKLRTLFSECKDKAFGISAIRWDARIQLTPIAGGNGNDPRCKGVITTHGSSVPVFDLRSDLGMSHVSASGNSLILVVSIQDANRQPVTLGILVNQSGEGIDLPEDILPSSTSNN